MIHSFARPVLVSLLIAGGLTSAALAQGGGKPPRGGGAQTQFQQPMTQSGSISPTGPVGRHSLATSPVCRVGIWSRAGEAGAPGGPEALPRSGSASAIRLRAKAPCSSSAAMAATARAFAAASRIAAGALRRFSW